MRMSPSMNLSARFCTAGESSERMDAHFAGFVKPAKFLRGAHAHGAHDGWSGIGLVPACAGKTSTDGSDSCQHSLGGSAWDPTRANTRTRGHSVDSRDAVQHTLVDRVERRVLLDAVPGEGMAVTRVRPVAGSG